MKLTLRGATTGSGRTFRWGDHFRLDPSSLSPRRLVGRSHLSVEEVLDLLADGYSPEELVAACPGLSAENVQACIAYTWCQHRLHSYALWVIILMFGLSSFFG